MMMICTTVATDLHRKRRAVSLPSCKIRQLKPDAQKIDVDSARNLLGVPLNPRGLIQRLALREEA